MTGTLMDRKNRMNIGQWRWLWHLRGGSMHARAHDLRDRRTLDLLERGQRLYLNIQKVRLKEQQPIKRPVNVAKRRIARAIKS